MEKIEVVLVLLDGGKLEDALKKLNLDNVNLAMMVTDADNDIDDAADDAELETDAGVVEDEIPQMTFSTVHKIEKKYKDFIWLLSGGNDPDALAKTKNFLMTLGVPEDNIINFEAPKQISSTWLANLRHVEEHGADFFATGNEYMQGDFGVGRRESRRRQPGFAAKLFDCAARLRTRQARHD